jgi:hypothetical protein
VIDLALREDAAIWDDVEAILSVLEQPLMHSRATSVPLDERVRAKAYAAR